ncbi:MAG: hypothetical protein HYT87_16315 [Nitrospirae bacterium]|nr:hypothetical protein [Nitrospirota bacterium]
MRALSALFLSAVFASGAWAQAGKPAPTATSAASPVEDEDATATNGFAHHTAGAGIYGQTTGVPPGVTFKYWLRETKAITFDVGYSSGSDQMIIVRSSYLAHDIAPLLKNIIPLYAGIGLSYVSTGNDKSVKDLEGLLLRVPLGVNFLLRRYPLELFVEAAPGVRLAKETRSVIDSSLGIRFYFY